MITSFPLHKLSRLTVVAIFCLWNAYGSMVLLHPVAANDAPTAAGLLTGARLARESITSMQCILEIEETSEAVRSNRKYKVEMLGDKLRFEELGDPSIIAISDGETRYHYTREEHAQLSIRAEHDAAFSTTVAIFDPRIIGLSDICPPHLKLDKAVWSGGEVTSRVIGREQLNGVDAWRVASTRGDAIAEFWVDASSFRVHRKTVETPTFKVDIQSIYEPNTTGILPSEVVATRTGGDIFTCRYKITSVDFRQIPEERFTFSTLELPLNTPAVDYGLKKAIGYWDGEAFSPNRLKRSEISPKPVASGQPVRRSYFLVIAFLIFLAIFVVVLRADRQRKA